MLSWLNGWLWVPVFPTIYKWYFCGLYCWLLSGIAKVMPDDLKVMHVYHFCLLAYNLYGTCVNIVLLDAVYLVNVG